MLHIKASTARIAIFTVAVALSLLIGLSSLMPQEVYSSAGWYILWITIGVALVAGIMMKQLRHHRALLIIHLSLLLMIVGGFCTALSSRRGTLHLLPAQTADTFITSKGKAEKLPEAVTLISFSPEYYPGMSFPKDFKTALLTASGDTMHISMNHIGRLKGYRFYQASYDNEGGTILTVTHDPIGIPIVYAGFLFFIAGGAWHLMGRLRRRRHTATICLLFISAFIWAGSASAVPAVPPSVADSLANRQVLFNGETVPFNTVATKLTYKLTGRNDAGGISPEAFLASLIEYRTEWSEVPFLKVKSKALREQLGIDGDYASVAQLYSPTGEYIPGSLYKGGDGPLDKEIIRLDEKIGLLIDLWNGELFTPLPSGARGLRSKLSIKSEVTYNRISPVRILFILTIIAALTVLLLYALRRTPRLWVALLTLCIADAGCYAWLWSLSPRIPLSDTSGMMQFISIFVILLAALESRNRNSSLLTGISLLGASFLLLVAWLGIKDPVISPVMPVLASPWLSVHVSLVMLAYAVLGFTLPVAVTALIIAKERERFVKLAVSLLEPGVFLLGLGIITGSMWANVSWGRYWAWDPKETWSLVTLLLYAIPLHRYFGMRKQPLFCAIYLIMAFSSILMTYFGVNLLPSLHAYN